MKRTNHILRIVIAVSILSFPFIIWAIYMNEDRKNAEKTSELFKNVFFEGEVLSVHEKNNSGIMCIEIDSANINSFNFFNHHGALKIESGIATFPLGFLNKDNEDDLFKLNATHVSVNKDTSGIMLFIKGDDTLSVPMDFWPGKIERCHMLYCDNYIEK